jgi:hypothetical protein
MRGLKLGSFSGVMIRIDWFGGQIYKQWSFEMLVERYLRFKLVLSKYFVCGYLQIFQRNLQR